VMSKVMQLKISKEMVEEATEKFLLEEIRKVCKKHNIVGEIEYQVNESAIEVVYPNLQEKIDQLEKRISALEGYEVKRK